LFCSITICTAIAGQQINARGGVAGRPIGVTILDDEGKPDVSAQLATQAVGGAPSP
jgi:ABC-type branched-subunit amino acid transport system substrate-binding protein